MPRGPKGERRPADVIGNAVHVMRIATGSKTTKLASCNSAADFADLKPCIFRSRRLRVVATGAKTDPA